MWEFRTTIRENRKWRRAFLIVTGAGTSLSVWVSAEGLELLIGTGLMPWALAGFGGALSYAFYAFLAEFMPRTRGWTLAWLTTLVMFVVLLVAATSTLLGVLGQAAPEALRIDMKVQLDRLEDHVDQMLRAHPIDEAGAVEYLGSVAQSHYAAAEDEIESAPISRMPGNGPTSSGLERLGQAYDEAADQLEAQSVRRAAAAAEAEAAMAALRVKVGSWDGSLEQMSQVRAVLAQEQQRLARALADVQRRVTPAETLAPVDVVIEQIANTPSTARNERKRERQQRANRALLAMAQESRASAETLLRGELEVVEIEDERPEVELTRPLEAVGKHWREVSVLIAYPVAIDLAPVLVLLCMWVLHSGLVTGTGPAVPTVRQAVASELPPMPVGLRGADSGSSAGAIKPTPASPLALSEADASGASGESDVGEGDQAGEGDEMGEGDREDGLGEHEEGEEFAEATDEEGAQAEEITVAEEEVVPVEVPTLTPQQRRALQEKYRELRREDEAEGEAA